MGQYLHTGTTLTNTIGRTYGFNASYPVYFDALSQSYGGCYVMSWLGLLPY
jgi:hypothetical protein